MNQQSGRHGSVPAPIEDSLRDKIQAMSCDIFRMLDCKGVVRIDYMFDRASEQVYFSLKSRNC